MIPPDESPPKGAWSAVGLLWFAGGSAYLTRTMLTTMRGSVVHSIPMSDADFGLLTSVFLWFYASLGPLGGFIGDRFSRKWVIVVSLFVWSAITVATSDVRTFGEFLTLRALLGLGQACYIPTAVALIVDFHRGRTRAFATGLNLTGMVCGSIIGSSCGWIAESYGWSFAYTAIGLPSIVLSIVLAFTLRDAPREGSERRKPGSTVRLGEALRSLARPGPYYWMFGSMAVQGAVSWIIIAWMPTAMGERFKLGEGAAGISALGILYVAQTSGLLLGGAWSDRWSRNNPRARILVPAFAILFDAPFFFLAGWCPWIWVTLASLGLYGLAMGFLGANQMAIVCMIVDERFRATALGILNAGTAIAGGLAIYGVGAMRDAGIGVGLMLMGAGGGVFLCGFMLWRIALLPRTVAEATT